MRNSIGFKKYFILSGLFSRVAINNTIFIAKPENYIDFLNPSLWALLPFLPAPSSIVFFCQTQPFFPAGVKLSAPLFSHFAPWCTPPPPSHPFHTNFLFRCLYSDRLVSCVKVKTPLHTRLFQGTVSLNVAGRGGGWGWGGLADEYTVTKG